MAVLARATTLPDLPSVEFLLLGGCEFTLGLLNRDAERRTVALPITCRPDPELAGRTPECIVLGAVEDIVVEDRAGIDVYGLDSLEFLPEHRLWRLIGASELEILVRVSELDITVLGS